MIKNKIIVFFLVLLIAIFTATLLYNFSFFKEKCINDKNQDITGYIETSSRLLINSYNRDYLENFELFKENVVSVAYNNDIIEYIQVVDIDGNVLFSSKKEETEFKDLGEIIEDKDSFINLITTKTDTIIKEEQDNAIKRIFVPISQDISGFQYVLVYKISYENYLKNISLEVEKNATYIGLVYLVLLFISIFVVYFLMKPIDALERGVRIINQGNFDYKIKIKEDGQIKNIALAFNRMAYNLKYLVQRSEKINALEQEVKQSKEELKEKFRDLQNKTGKLEQLRTALLNLTEDANTAKTQAISEKDKTVAIINNFADALIVLNPDNKISLVNPLAEQIFDVMGKDFIGLTLKEAKEKNPTFAKLHEIIGDAENEIYRQEFKKDEGMILEVSTAFVEKRGKLEEKIIVVHDITREKMVDKTKSEFITIAAHQLRTPLSAIKWIFQMMAEGDWGEISKEQKEYLTKGFTSTERLVKIVNDLLNVSRIEEGRFVSKPELGDIAKVFESSHKEHIALAEEGHVNLKLDISKVPQVKFDEEKIKIVFDNLVENAIKYTPPDGIVAMSLKDKGDGNILISVSDTGIGIPQKDQARLFAKFFRGDNALRIQTEGSGMGLFVAKNIIESHGGKIWFESEENKGTTFFITLPM